MHPLDYFLFCPHCASHRFVISSPSSKKCDDCGFEFFKSPSPGVAVFIVNDKKQLLVVKRSKAPAENTWDLPGGFIELGETAEDAAVREVKEETGLDIEVDEYQFSIPNLYMFSGMDVRPLDIFFTAHICSKAEISLDLSENSDLQWLDIEKINSDDFGLPSIKKAISLFVKSVGSA